MADSSTSTVPPVATPAPDNTTTVAPEAEAETGFEDNDSAYGEEQSAYSASLTSSIKNHTFENGRRYASHRPIDGTAGYFAPNDDAEAERLDMHHHLSKLLTGGHLVTAPIGKNPQRILDAGTGTGIWAIEAGDEYPSAEIIGVDISPTQPSIVPPNVKFEIDDLESDWTYNRQFDYIHSRFMAASIADWPRYVGQIFKHTEPGGWAEFKDWDHTIRSGDNSVSLEDPMVKYHSMMFQAITAVGRDYKPGPSVKQWCIDAGFENVKETVEAVPLGGWARDKRYKEIGAWNMLCLVEGLEGIAMRLFVGVLGMTPEEVLVFLVEVRTALKKNRGVHAFHTHYVVTAQKPGGKTKEKEFEAAA